jgi:tetratricopeptide (TPR) repeat protein
LHQRLRDDHKAAQLLSDLDEWRTLLASAEGAWKRADRLAEGDQDMISPELRGRLAVLGGHLQADEADRQLAFTLDAIRLETTNLVEGEIRLQPAGPKLAKAFRDAGYNLQKDQPAQTADRIRASPIRVSLVAGLDFWALATEERRMREHLLAVARRADPDPWRDRLRQVAVWDDRAGLTALAGEVNCSGQSPQLLAALALRLFHIGGDPSALLRRALLSYPRDFWLHFGLGIASRNPTEQAGAFRAALAVRPRATVAHYNLGVVLYAEKHRDEALACYRRAVAIEPRHSGAQNNLGLILEELGKADEAMTHYRLAIKAEPGTVTARLNLGSALQSQKKLDEAITWYHEALGIDPKSVAAHNNLGTALREQKKLSEAIRWLRKATDLEPEHAMAWCNLGHTLRQDGQFREALTALQRGHELGSRDKDWRHPSGIWVIQAKQSIVLDEKLSAVLRGEEVVASGREQAGMAEMCMGHRKRYAAAVRLYTAAFAADPRLVADLNAKHRYHAACAAALAAACQDQEGKHIGSTERAGFRKQGLDWLRAQLAAQADALDRHADRAAAIGQELGQWQTDADLEGVRQDAALARLSADEQTAWRQFWADVAALRQQARARKAISATK